MQKYIHYNKWTGTINSQSKKKSDYSLLLSTNELDKLLEYGLENYIVHNNQVIKIYERYLKDKDRETNQSPADEDMGFLSSISDARIFLEKLY